MLTGAYQSIPTFLDTSSNRRCRRYRQLYRPHEGFAAALNEDTEAMKRGMSAEVSCRPISSSTPP